MARLIDLTSDAYDSVKTFSRVHTLVNSTLKQNYPILVPHEHILRDPRQRVEIELVRLRCLRSIFKRITSALEKHGITRGQGAVAAFERWRFVAHREQQNEAMNTHKSKQIVQDPLIPSRASDAGFKNELMQQHNLSEEDAQTICAQLSRAATKAVIEIQRHVSTLSRSNIRLEPIQVTIIQPDVPSMGQKPTGNRNIKKNNSKSESSEETELQVQFNVGKAIRSRINVLYLLKLERLMFHHEERNASSAIKHEIAPDSVAYDANLLRKHVASLSQHTRAHITLLLMRYEGLCIGGGGGFQAACHDSVFDVLRKEANVQFECFASPFNCRFPTYCSAFYDTDSPFGSIGSFFDFFPTMGSYEANPPFVDELILAMAEHIDNLLDKTTKPLSFIVIVPHWDTRTAWQRLNNSPFLRRHERLAQRDHGYTEGSQHLRNSKYRISTCDTSIFVIQNDAGYDRWPITSNVIENVCRAFQSRHVDKIMEKPSYSRPSMGSTQPSGNSQSTVKSAQHKTSREERITTDKKRRADKTHTSPQPKKTKIKQGIPKGLSNFARLKRNSFAKRK